MKREIVEALQEKCDVCGDRLVPFAEVHRCPTCLNILQKDPGLFSWIMAIRDKLQEGFAQQAQRQSNNAIIGFTVDKEK